MPALAARRDVHGLALLLSCGLLLCGLSGSGLFGCGFFGCGFFGCGLLGGGLLCGCFLLGGLLLGGGLFGCGFFGGLLLGLLLCRLLLGDCLLLCGVIGRGICGFTADRKKYEEGSVSPVCKACRSARRRASGFCASVRSREPLRPDRRRQSRG